MSWVATASSKTVESTHRFRRPRKIPVPVITSATASNTRSGRAEAAIRLRQYTSVEGSKLICVSDRPQATFHRISNFSASAATADLFPSRTGRPSLPADLVGSVLVLKELYDLSDPQTADALKFDIRWKVACGRSLTQVSFDPSALVYWRKRIAEPASPDRRKALQNANPASLPGCQHARYQESWRTKIIYGGREQLIALFAESGLIHR